MVNFKGKGFVDCLNIISNNTELSIEFRELYNITANKVLKLSDKLPIATLDTIVYNTNKGVSNKHIINSSIGVISDSYDLLKEILSTRAMRRALNSNKCKRILVVAGGLGTEIDVLVELYGIDILDKIVYNEKYSHFCNIIKEKYPQITILQNDFLKLEIDMKFDVVVNPPYQKDNIKNSKLYPAFYLKSYELLKDNGTIAFITPSAWLNHQFLID